MSEFLIHSGMDAKHILLLAVVVGGVIAIVAHKAADVAKARAKEQTRREIAAYVAEGSIDPEQAQRLMGIEPSDIERKIADAVAWGMLSSAKAESLLRAFREREGQDGRSGNPARS